jgi:hypothetical protein
LIESLVTEVIVVDPEPARRAFSVNPIGVEQALAEALDDQDKEVTSSLLSRSHGRRDGVYTVVADVRIPLADVAPIARDLEAVGGEYRWYGCAWGWALRLALGRLFGEHLRLQRPHRVVAGATVDWWRIARSEPGELILRSVGWFPGDAWLGYRVNGGSLRQVAAFRPLGIPGFLYWRLLSPIHLIVFRRMARHRLRRVR